ncbi:MAG: YidC/Oxa1 family membrane protein insertase [Syntrophomonadaceae bacterium]|nr:YidC/Oxa1 family membrane protein insertase [Syntrophomonadaceae bacterium]
MENLLFPIENSLYHLMNFIKIYVGSYGFAIVSLSLIVTVFLFPFKYLLKLLSAKPNKIMNDMKPFIEKINALDIPKSKKAVMRDSLYKHFKYSPLYVFINLLPLLIQLPFLISMYYMIIHNAAELEGQSFLFVADISLSDGILFGVNLLPIMMTVINILAALIMPDAGKKEIIQSFSLAFVFMILLYNVPAAAVIYWTANNIIILVTYLFLRFWRKKNEKPA